MVERQSDMNDSAETNFDSLVSVSRPHDIENSEFIRELIREVTRLRHEVA